MTRNNRERADAERNNYLYSHNTHGLTLEQELAEMIREQKGKPKVFNLWLPKKRGTPKRKMDDKAGAPDLTKGETE